MRVKYKDERFLASKNRAQSSHLLALAMHLYDSAIEFEFIGDGEEGALDRQEQEMYDFAG